MRRLVFPVVALVVGAGVIVNCGGDDDGGGVLGNVPDASIDGSSKGTTQDSGGSAQDSGTPQDSSTTGDATSDADAGPAPIPDGGAPSDPQTVKCGTAECTISTQFCCQQPDGGASCQTSGGACSALGGAKQECNEAADCPHTDAGQQVCCFDVTEKGLESSCRADCNGGGGTRFQACRTTTECKSGSCAVHACNGDAGFSTVETCNPIPGICP
jgi:hypothetical protein